jgi:hypothetical protein
MPWTGWPRIPVQPGRSRTDRQTCGGCGPAADLPADTDPWHQCKAGISDQSLPRTTGGPLDGRTQLDLAAALDQLTAVYWRAGFPARR